MTDDIYYRVDWWNVGFCLDIIHENNADDHLALEGPTGSFLTPGTL